MANKVFINTDHDQAFVECQVVGDQTPESIDQMGKQISKLLAELKAKHKPALALDDVTRMGKVPAAGRDKVVALAKDLPYTRLAMIGKGGLLRMGANLLIRASGRRLRLRYFNSREEALTWLFHG